MKGARWRRWAGFGLIGVACGLLLIDLDKVPPLSLALALAAIAGAGVLLSGRE